MKRAILITFLVVLGYIALYAIMVFAIHYYVNSDYVIPYQHVKGY